MIKQLFILSILLGSVFFCHPLGTPPQKADVTIVGCIRFSNGIGRNSIAALDYLQDSLKMNFINTRPSYSQFNDVPLHVLKLVEKKDHTPANVAILYEALKLPTNTHYTKVPQSKIRLAYSMVESTQIPREWTMIINSHFDAVVVPDVCLIEVYKNSGVTKPIFVVPHPVYMDEFQALRVKTKQNPEFTFGSVAAPSINKNCELLIYAFAKEFKNSPHVKLVIHTTASAKNKAALKLKKRVSRLNAHNIIIDTGSLPWITYIKLMQSFDCYVLVSKGEGFSITPREALAAGIPCIISNNTAHKTICQSGFVYGVPSNILDRHSGEGYGEQCGYSFNCTMADVQKGLREVYENYQLYLEKAAQGREWVKQYHGKNLKPLYLNLFKPQKVILGNENKVTAEYLMTTDKNLHRKYLSLHE